jgi:hypothetical protein
MMHYRRPGDVLIEIRRERECRIVCSGQNFGRECDMCQSQLRHLDA